MPVMRPRASYSNSWAGPAHAHDPPLGTGQVVFVLHTAAHAVQPLEQPAIGVVGIALEHVAVRLVNLT